MPNYEYDYSALRGRIKEKVGTEGEFAKRINRSRNYVSKIFQGMTYFRAKDVVNASKVLELEPEQIGPYFYTIKVHKNVTN